MLSGPKILSICNLKSRTLCLKITFFKLTIRKIHHFLIVHFPSQHTREEVMRDINSHTLVMPGRKSTSESSVPSLHAPVKFMRAGSSQVGFILVPGDHESIPVSLENLLDWKNYDLQVNYRARWFNQMSGISLIKSQLQTATMAYSAKSPASGMQLRTPDVSFRSQPIKAVNSKIAPGCQFARRPKSALEVKVIMSTTPKGPGVMALSDDRFYRLAG